MMACHDLSSVPSNASSTKSNLYKTVAENKYYNINSLACRLFKEIASSDSKTRSVLYSGMVANKLIKSIISMLHGSLETREGGVGGSGGGKGAESMETPNNVADLLSHIVSGESGRAFIMTHQIQLSINDSIQEPSHSIIQEINGSIIPCIIAQFVKRNLEEGMTTVRSCSLETLGYYIYFLRQIYGTCGGLLLLQQYELHNVLVEGDSLKQAALRDAMVSVL